MLVRTLWVVLVLALSGEAVAAMSVPRTIDDVVWAIGLSRRVPTETKKMWATAIIEEATQHEVDPFTLVAIINNESRFNPEAVDPSGDCIGFAQYCLSNLPACREDVTSAECQRKRRTLLNWRGSLAQLGADITQWRSYCRRVTGQPALFARWLAGYQGAYARDRGVTCGMRKVKGRWRDVPRRAVTARVMNYRLRLDKERRRSR